MSITRISIEDMPKPKHGPGAPALPEWDAVRALEVGQAAKLTCHWAHAAGPRGKNCTGTASAHRIARVVGIKVRATCQDGFLYVGRLA